MVFKGDWIIYFADLLLLLFYLGFVIMKSVQFTVKAGLWCMLKHSAHKWEKTPLYEHGEKNQPKKPHFHYVISRHLWSGLNMITSGDW